MMPAQSLARDADASRSPNSAPRVLLVEDERAVGDALTDCLEQIGCTVIAAPDLNSANASARDDAQVFDVAILDLELPDGNGLEIYCDTRQALDGDTLWRGQDRPLAREHILAVL